MEKNKKFKNKKNIIFLLVVILITLGIYLIINNKPPKKVEIEGLTTEELVIEAQNDTTIDYKEFNEMFYKEKYEINSSGYNSPILESEWNMILNKYPDTTKQKIIDKELFLLKHIQGADIFWLATSIIDGRVNEGSVNYCVWGKGWNIEKYNNKMIMSDLKLFYKSFLNEVYNYPKDVIEFDTIYVYNNDAKNIFYLIGKGSTDSLNFCSAIPLNYINNNFILDNDLSTPYNNGITHLCESKEGKYCCDFSFNEKGDIVGCKNCSDIDKDLCKHKIITPVPISKNLERFLNKILPYIKI
jgi:hypothetical protein